MNKKQIIPILIAALMLLSGVTVLASVSVSGSTGHNASASSANNPLYTVTFKANGLLNSPSALSSWQLWVDNSTLTPVNIVGDQGTVAIHGGQYYYQATDFFQTFYSPKFTVGSDMTVDVNFTAAHTITFTSPGVPSNNTWGVSFSTGLSYNPVYSQHQTVAGGNAVTYYAIPGDYQYAWYVDFYGHNNTVGSSNFYMGNTNLTLSLPSFGFSNVTFSPTNLPSGTKWFLTQYGGPDSYSVYDSPVVVTSSATAMLSLENGANTFTYGYIQYGKYITMGNITVNAGSSYSYALPFPAMTNVTFQPNTAFQPYTMEWGIKGQFTNAGLVNSFNISASNNRGFGVLLPSVDTSITPYLAMGYQTGGTGSLYWNYLRPFTFTPTVATSTQTIDLPAQEQVTLAVQGLPAGTYATITSVAGPISGYWDNTSYASPAKLLATNGSYTFLAIISGSVQETVPFSVDVHGATTKGLTLHQATFNSPDKTTTFSLQVYSGITSYIFTQSASKGASVSGYLPSGTYQFYSEEYNSGPSHLEAYTNGTFTLGSLGVTENMPYPSSYINMTVQISGLPSGTNWQAAFTSLNYSVYGLTEGGNSTSQWIDVPAGSYQFVLNSLSQSSNAYYATNQSVVNVSAGGPKTVQLHASSTSLVSFNEYGLAAGIQWSVTMGGKTYKSVKPAITVAGPLGEMTQSLYYTIGDVAGYTANPQSGYVNLSVSSGTSNLYGVHISFTPDRINANPAGMNTITLSDHALHPGSYLSSSQTYSAGAVAFDSSTGNVYISYESFSGYGQSGIQVYNSTTFSYIKEIPVPAYMQITDMVIDHSTGFLYAAANSNSNPYILSVNLADGAASAHPSRYAVESLMIGPSGKLLYGAGSQGVFALNITTMGLAAYIPVGNSYHDYSSIYYPRPYTLLYSGTTGLIYAVGYSNDSITAINPATNSVSGTFGFAVPMYADTAIGGAAIDTSNGNIYFQVTNENFLTDLVSSYIEVFNTATGKFTGNISLPDGFSATMAYDASTSSLYLPMDLAFNYSYYFGGDSSMGELVKINTLTGKVAGTYDAGLHPYQSAVDPQNGYVFVSNEGSDSVNIMPMPAVGYLAGTVTSKYATITVDGIAVPQNGGSFNISLSPGTYYVTAYAPGYASASLTATITAGRSTVENIGMSRATTYEVTGHVMPGSASVTLNGASAAVSSNGSFSIFVAAGNYTLSSYLQGYFPYSKNIDVSSNMSENISLVKEPSPTSTLKSAEIVGDGFNATVANLTSGTGNISLDFTSTGNGTITIQVPYSSLSGVNVSYILHSRVYINGNPYTSFTVTISSNYTIVLTVYGLNGDPHLVWNYSPSAYVPPAKSPAGNSMLLYVGIAAAAVAVAILAFLVMRRRKA